MGSSVRQQISTQPRHLSTVLLQHLRATYCALSALDEILRRRYGECNGQAHGRCWWGGRKDGCAGVLSARGRERGREGEKERGERAGAGAEMGSGPWSRFKRWIKHRLFTAFWPIVQSRLFRKLRSLVSKSLLPVSVCAAGAAIGVGAASALCFPLSYGALAGVAATVGAFGIVRLYQRLFPPQQTSRFISVFRSRRVTPSGRLVITDTTVRGKHIVSRR